MNILLTGGAGYIGSHTLIELDKAGHSVVVVDNFYNSQPEAIRRVEQIIGHQVIFIEADIRDRAAMDKVFTEHKIDAVINFAGLKAVGESVAKPLMYYETNMNGVFVLIDVMQKHGCKNIIFSSSATVYGDPAIIPITEECPKGQCTNPYGWTKSMIEQVLMDVQKADPEWNVVTHDGTGVRDYIHVVDLANGHVCALKAIQENKGLAIYNLGTGHGYSVLDVVKAFEKANGLKVPYAIKPRRPGDIATCYCDPAKAKRELGWEAKFGIEEMCRDSWRFQKNNPNGYE